LVIGARPFPPSIAGAFALLLMATACNGLLGNDDKVLESDDAGVDATARVSADAAAEGAGDDARREASPSADSSDDGGSEHGDASNDGLSNDGLSNDGLSNDGPSNDGPSNDGPGSEAGVDTGSNVDASNDDAEAGLARDGAVGSLGLVAFYPFDELGGTTAADASGNNWTATLMGGATFATGLQNNAVTLDGNSQYVSLPSGILSGLTSFSICAWVKLNAAPAWSHIFNFGTGTTAYMFLTPNSSSSTLRFSITSGGSGSEQQINAPGLPTGTWQHVTVILAASSGTLYVNGVQVAQDASLTLNPASLGSTTQNWIGRSAYSADPYLNGQIDNFRIYDRALSATEVQTLYASHL
jgi:hypothetical protein